MKHRLFDGCAVLASVLLTGGSAFAADWGFDATLGLDHSDNLSNAIEAEDRKPDSAVTAGISVVLHQPIGDNTGLGLSLVAETADYFNYSGMDNLAAGASARILHKFGLGPDVPRAAFSLRALHRDYHYDYRDGWQYDAGLSVAKRFGERWDLSGSVLYDRYTADHLQQEVLPGISSAAYDVAGWTFGAQAAYLVTGADTLSFSYSRRHGSVTAVTPPDFEVLEYSDAVARDPVFSGNTIAYRINADADTLSATWSHAIGRHASVNLGYAYRRTQGDEELDAYTANMINLSISYSR